MSLLLPAYLLGLAGLALPWLLHRFSDQNPPQQDFPSRRFLEATTPPVSRKRMLRYRVLLALRAAALLLLCFLFAQPWINRSVDALGGQQHHFVAIDQSLSMRAGDRWERALDQAADILAELDGTGPVDLIGFADNVNVVASNTREDANPTDALRSMQAGYLPADYGVLMTQLNKLAADIELPVKLWLLTDVQNTALPVQLNALYAPNVDELELVAVPGEPAENVYLNARAESADNVNVTVSAALQYTSNAADAPDVLDRTVIIEFRERQLASRQVQLSINQLETVVFDDLVLPAHSNPVLQIRLSQNDALDEDNRMELPVQQGNPASVALLQAGSRSADDATVFLRTAFETDDAADVELVRGGTDQVPDDVLHVLTGQEWLEGPDPDILRFVDTGGNVLLFNRRIPDNNRDVLIQGSAIGEINQAHPLSLGSIDWYGVRFYQLPDIQLDEDDRVLMKTRDEQIVLFEKSTDRGRLLILNDPLDGLASNLPLQPAFVSLMKSVLAYFDASTSIPRVVTVGTRVALPANMQVLGPDEQPLVSIDDNSRNNSLHVQEPGLYTVLGARGEQKLQVIPDRAESDLSVLDEATIRNWVSRFDQNRVNETGLTDSADAAADASLSQTAAQASERARESLWFLIFPLLMAALLLESLYANRRLDVRRDGS